MRSFNLAVLHTITFVLLTACPVPKETCDSGECVDDTGTPTVEDTGDCVDDTGDTTVDVTSSLIGIGYNDATESNELRSIDPATAIVTTLTSFDFDSG
tara:strand:- start:2 stop:295 length:294 start_codon:yes stop_codon:yes gene_type:complete